MIVGTQPVLRSSTEITLDGLGKMDTKFYLTGSRYFGVAKPDSDWDFFAEHTPALEQVLVGCGFYKLGKAYEDYKTVCVMEKGKVQIQLVRQAEIKYKIQQTVKDLAPGFLNDRSKVHAKLLWNLLFACVNIGNDVAVVTAKLAGHDVGGNNG